MRCAGASDKPLVLMLHGYPECWFSWRAQLKGLNSNDYYLVAIDMRGFGESEKPVGVEHYVLEEFVEDVKGFLVAINKTSAILISHGRALVDRPSCYCSRLSIIASFSHK